MNDTATIEPGPQPAADAAHAPPPALDAGQALAPAADAAQAPPQAMTPDAPHGRPLRRRTWITVGLAGAAAGAWLAWPALQGAGVASLLLGLAPCLAMCALGLCMRGGASTCAKGTGAAAASTAATISQTPAGTVRAVQREE